MNATIIKNVKVPTTKQLLDFVLAINVTYMPMYVVQDWPTMIDVAKELKRRGLEDMIRYFNDSVWDKRIESLIKDSDFNEDIWNKIEETFRISATNNIERFFNLDGDDLCENIAEENYEVVKYIASVSDYASNKPSDQVRLNSYVSIFDSAFKYIKKDDIDYEILKKNLKKYRLFTRINIHNIIRLDIEDIEYIKDSLVDSANLSKTIINQNIFKTACRLNIDYKRFILESNRDKVNLYISYISDRKADSRMLKDLFELDEEYLKDITSSISFLCRNIALFEDKKDMVITFLECKSKAVLKCVALSLPMKYLYIMTQIPTIRSEFSEIIKNRIEQKS